MLKTLTDKQNCGNMCSHSSISIKEDNFAFYKDIARQDFQNTIWRNLIYVQ